MNYKSPFLAACYLICCLILFFQCNEKRSMGADQSTAHVMPPMKNDYNGFKSQVAWGEHLVIIGGCHDCHTPKKMSLHGPVLDSSLWLSGHQSQNPPLDVDRSALEAKGLSVTSDLTEWAGPWGVSYTANLTPDPTGIGNWTEEQFIYCLRNGKLKGLEGSRNLLPPMPWEMSGQMTDNELKAVFAYLKSIKPINNLVPAPLPPLTAMK
jgi:mono/diheme cytochrome c family protein